MNEQEARGFDEIASTIFSPIYPVISRQILERTGKCNGTAIDLGCGPAHLAVAVAKESDLKIFALDNNPIMLKIALGHISEGNLVKKVVPVLGDVHSIPFEDETMDLVFSRGSWFFWDHLELAFKEIYRVLIPGGYAYIGGGFGNSILKDNIFTKMRSIRPDFEKETLERGKKNNPDRIEVELHKAGITSYDLIRDDTGFWVSIRR